jgi:hypothetical protein
MSANFFVTEAGNALAELGNIHEDDGHAEHSLTH